MPVSFADDELGRLCSCLHCLQLRWGPDGGRRLGRRLRELDLAPDLGAVRALPGGCRSDGSTSAWKIDVARVATIHFAMIHVPQPRPPSDWVHVTKIVDVPIGGEEGAHV